MSLSYSGDVSAADWIVSARIPWTQLVTFGPAQFPAYARLRFIPDPSRPGQAETDADIAEDHLLDLQQTRLALHHLRRFTTTPENCFFCVWEGYSDVHFPPSVLAGRMVTIPHRRYVLLQGSLDLDGWAEALGGAGNLPPPAFAWPADQSWCFASDVDPHWAGIGADEAAINTLLDVPGLDVVPAEPSEPQPTYY